MEQFAVRCQCAPTKFVSLQVPVECFILRNKAHANVSAKYNPTTSMEFQSYNDML